MPALSQLPALVVEDPRGGRPLPVPGSRDGALLGDQVTNITARRQAVRVEAFTTPEEFRDYFKARYGPVIAAYRGLADDAQRTAALDRDLASLASRHDSGSVAMIMEWEYLLITAEKR